MRPVRLAVFSPEWRSMEPLVFPVGLSFLESAVAAVLDELRSPYSRTAYAVSFKRFFAWYETEQPAKPFGKALILAHRRWLLERNYSPSTINLAMCALRRTATEAGEQGLLDANMVATAIRAKGVHPAAVRPGRWLSKEQANALLALPSPATLTGLRDRALLALLLGCGLRRTEAAEVELSQLRGHSGTWVLEAVMGKGRRSRDIPMPAWVKVAIDDWSNFAGINSGPILRRAQYRRIGAPMTAGAVAASLERYQAALGESITPCDLRKTYARLAYENGAPLEQIQLALGHQSIETTMRYIGARQNLSRGPGDYLPIRLPPRIPPGRETAGAGRAVGAERKGA